MEFYADRYGIMRAGRFMAIKIPVPKLVDILKTTDPDGKGYTVENGLPADARIVTTSTDWLGPVQVFYIVAESDEWPLLYETDPIPLLSPTIRGAYYSGKKPRKGAKKQGRGVVDDDRPPFGPGSDEDPDTFPPVEEEGDNLPI